MVKAKKKKNTRSKSMFEMAWKNTIDGIDCQDYRQNDNTCCIDIPSPTKHTHYRRSAHSRHRSTASATSSYLFNPSSPFPQSLLQSFLSSSSTLRSPSITSQHHDAYRFLIKFAKALIANGAPSHRLDHCVQLLTCKFRMIAQVGYFPGFLVISLGDPETLKQSIQLVKVDSGLDLYRLTRIYQLFESILCDEISLKEATHMLDPILLQPSLYPQWMIILAYGVSSSTSTSLFFTGNHADMFIGFFLGIFVAVGYLNVSRHVTRFASIFDVLISAVVGFLAAAISTRLSSTTSCFYALSIGGIVSLLPGYATLISLLELAAGSIMAGTLRLTTTLVYSLLLGFGLAIGSSVHEFLWPSLIFKSSESVCTAGLSAYYHILLVPLFAAANIVILCGHPRKFPIMLILAILAHSVQYISLESLVTYRHLATVLASFVVGFSANIYARLCSTVGFVDMIAGLLFLVPGSVGVTSSLGSFGQMLTTGNTIAEVFVIAHAGQQGIVFAAHMLVITVSISLGLVLAAVAIYPLRKIMDFRYQTSHRYRRKNWVGEITF